ncbi:MAG TPA: nucleotidyltransferase family protein [Planctomycetes bacterium]|nr:nucleotidyltransferase family protein [Fuerstiella sp.]HIK94053.1 nucleotidyltransferase family protein [Planctomycetota bacterium]
MKCFGIIPAAGQSLRMGAEHKLLLPWRNETVIDHVLRAWTESVAQQVVAIVRSDDIPLQQACRRWPGIDLVIPEEDPPDMKMSIQLGLQRIAAVYEPDDVDRWMVAPADLPTLTSELIDQVIEASSESDSVIVPRFGDRRGHPVSFPWSQVPQVFKLGADQGVNSLPADDHVQWLDLPADERPDDMDTPADYLRLRNEQKPS